MGLNGRNGPVTLPAIVGREKLASALDEGLDRVRTMALLSRRAHCRTISMAELQRPDSAARRPCQFLFQSITLLLPARAPCARRSPHKISNVRSKYFHAGRRI